VRGRSFGALVAALALFTYLLIPPLVDEMIAFVHHIQALL
jgi:hypothetical protein